MMTHDEYVSRLDSWTDGDAAAVLRHASSCSECGRESRAAARSLASFSPKQRSHAEEGVRILAAAATFALVIWGLPAMRNAAAPQTQSPARYRIVGTSSGVVAETPEGLVAAGHLASTTEKEISR